MKKIIFGIVSSLLLIYCTIAFSYAMQNKTFNFGAVLVSISKINFPNVLNDLSNTFSVIRSNFSSSINSADVLGVLIDFFDSIYLIIRLIVNEIIDTISGVVNVIKVIYGF